jgi:hypothetical protein
VLGFVRYAVPASAAAGDVALSLADAVAMEDGTTELGSCAPVVATAMNCVGATVTIAPVSVLIDCNLAAPGVQSVCNVSNMAATRDVNVVARNNSAAPWTLGTFNFTMIHLDDSRLYAPSIQDFLNGNPDFIGDTTDLSDWACGPGGPDNDLLWPVPGEAAPGQESFISCFNAVGSGPSIAPGGLNPLATVHYNIAAGADPGSATITLRDVGIADSTFTERGSCNPGSLQPGEIPAHCPTTELIFYCPIDRADVNNDGRVTSIDLGITASQFFANPPNLIVDQNFDNVINSIDLGLIASHFNKFVTQCP